MSAEEDFTPHCAIEPEYRQVWCDFKLPYEAICLVPATHRAWWRRIELHYCDTHYAKFLACCQTPCIHCDEAPAARGTLWCERCIFQLGEEWMQEWKRILAAREAVQS